MRGPLSKLCLLVVIAFTALTSAALAYWGTGGSGTGSGDTATLTKPVVTVPANASGDITVSWSASTLIPSNPAGNALVNYTVERSANSGGSWTAACGGATINGLTCDDAVGSSGNYVYRVTAHLNSWSELSDTSSSVARRPARPVVSNATGVATIATVTGTAEAGSNVKLYTDSTCTTAALDALGNAGASGTATGGSFSIQATVPAGESRTFCATSTANSLTSDCSTTSAAYSAPNVAPQAPNDLAAAAQPPTGTTATFGDINLTWTAVANATSYQVFRSTTSNPSNWGSSIGTVSQPVGGAGSQVTFSNTPPAFGTYYYSVKAVTGVLDSDFSSQASATTRIRPPTNPGAGTQGQSNLRVQWTAPSPIPVQANQLRYNVYRSSSSAGPFSLLSACSGISAAQCTDSNVPAGTTYHYRVTAFVTGFPGSESVQTATVSATR